MSQIFITQRVDVFDQNFAPVNTIHLNDSSIPDRWGPFNIENIQNSLFVTYAKQKPPDYVDDDPGPSREIVNIFEYDGTLHQRFISYGNLNSPWGIALSTSEFDGGNNILRRKFRRRKY